MTEHYAVEVRDDHDGGSVWYIEDNSFESFDEAEEEAARVSLKRRDYNGVARVIKVTHEVVARFRNGQPERDYS